MQLPQIQYSRAEPFKLPSPWTPVKVGAAQTQMLQAVAEPINNIYQGIQKDKAMNWYGKAVTQLAEVQAEAATNADPVEAPEIVKRGINKIESEAKNSLSPDAFFLFKDKFEPKATTLHANFIVDSAIKANSEQRQQLSAEALGIAKSGDLDTALEVISGATMFSDSEKEDLISSARYSYEYGVIENVRYSDDPALIKKTLDHLKSENYHGSLEGPKRASAIKALESAYGDSIAEAEAKRIHEEGKVWGDLKLKVSRGEASFLEIDEAYDAFPDVITDSRRAELMSLAEKVSHEKRKNASMSYIVDQALLNGEPLDPKNSDHKAAVNQYFEQNPDFQTGIELAAKTNIMPDKLKGDFRRLAFLGSPKKVLELANAYEILERESPLSVDQIGTKQTSIYETTAEMYRAGAPLEEAVRIARENASKPPEQVALLRNEYSQQHPLPDVTERLKDLMDSDDKFDISFWFRGAPEPSAAIKSSYAALEQEYYTLTGGDIELASKLAFKHVGRIFSTSEINDKQEVFAYAPERVTGIDSDWLRKDLKKYAKDHGLDPDSIYIVPDAQTARDKGIKSYPVYHINEFGNPEPTELRWIPDVERYNKQKLEKAKKERESLRKAYEGSYPWPKGSFKYIDWFD